MQKIAAVNTAGKENNFNVEMPIPLIFLIGISTLFFAFCSRRERSHIQTHHYLIHCRLIPIRNSVYNRIKALFGPCNKIRCRVGHQFYTYRSVQLQTVKKSNILRSQSCNKLYLVVSSFSDGINNSY